MMQWLTLIYIALLFKGKIWFLRFFFYEKENRKSKIRIFYEKKNRKSKKQKYEDD